MRETALIVTPSPAYDIPWRDAPATRHLPAGVGAWLLDPGSLTARLIRHSGGQFRVQLLQHGRGRATADERALLGLRWREAVIIREVLLLCHGIPWVYARSVLPVRTLRGPHRYLRTFGARSLGAHLFGHARCLRDPFQVTRVPARCLPAAVTGDDGTLLWGRRSRFYLDGEPLSVAEIFLPAFRPWTD